MFSSPHIIIISLVDLGLSLEASAYIEFELLKLKQYGSIDIREYSKEFGQGTDVLRSGR